MIHVLKDTEVVLPDDYPVYPNYTYIIDRKFTRNNSLIGTVRQLKKHLGVAEIRRCDLFEHPGAKLGDYVYKNRLEI